MSSQVHGCRGGERGRKRKKENRCSSLGEAIREASRVLKSLSTGACRRNADAGAGRVADTSIITRNVARGHMCIRAKKRLLDHLHVNTSYIFIYSEYNVFRIMYRRAANSIDGGVNGDPLMSSELLHW